MSEKKIECPEGLLPEAKKEWERIVPVLDKLELLKKDYVKPLSAYCMAYARWKEAEQKLNEEGSTIVTKTGYIQQSPYVNIALNNLKQMLSLCQEFGMTPASRSRIMVSDDPWVNSPIRTGKMAPIFGKDDD